MSSTLVNIEFLTKSKERLVSQVYSAFCTYTEAYICVYIRLMYTFLYIPSLQCLPCGEIVDQDNQKSPNQDSTNLLCRCKFECPSSTCNKIHVFILLPDIQINLQKWALLLLEQFVIHFKYYSLHYCYEDQTAGLSHHSFNDKNG